MSAPLLISMEDIMNTIIERIRKAENLISESEKVVCNVRNAYERNLRDFTENGFFSNEGQVKILVHDRTFLFIRDMQIAVERLLNGIENTGDMLSRMDACWDATMQLGTLEVKLTSYAIRTGLISPIN